MSSFRRCLLNSPNDLVVCMFSGSLFHSLVAEGKNECLYNSVLQFIGYLSCMRRLWYRLTSEDRGGNLGVMCSGRRPFVNLKNRISLCLFRLSFSGIMPVSL